MLLLSSERLAGWWVVSGGEMLGIRLIFAELSLALTELRTIFHQLLLIMLGKLNIESIVGENSLVSGNKQFLEHC